MRAGFHQIHGQFLADDARNHDERQIKPSFTQDFQRRQHAKSRHLIIAKNHIPRLPSRASPIVAGFHTRSWVAGQPLFCR